MTEPGDDRRERILVAALKEFAARGFEAASTNAIADAAGVAKGLVFHHFGNKEGLFVAVAEDAILRTTEAIYGDASHPLPSDLFERLHLWMVKKLRAFQRDPRSFQFLITARFQSPPHVRALLDAKYAALLAAQWPRFLAGIDATRLRPGLTVAQAVETLSLLAEGLERKLQPRLVPGSEPTGQVLDSVSETAWEHFVRLRDGLYRRGPPEEP